MSLTDKTYKHIAGLVPSREELSRFIFAESSDLRAPASSPASLAALRGPPRKEGQPEGRDGHIDHLRRRQAR